MNFVIIKLFAYSEMKMCGNGFYHSLDKRHMEELLTVGRNKMPYFMETIL